MTTTDPEAPAPGVRTSITLPADKLARALHLARAFAAVNDPLYPALEGIELRTTRDGRTLVVAACDRWKVAWVRLPLPAPVQPFRSRIQPDSVPELIDALTWPADDPDEWTDEIAGRLTIDYPDQDVTLGIIDEGPAAPRSHWRKQLLTVTPARFQSRIRTFHAIDIPDILDALTAYERMALSSHWWRAEPGMAFGGQVFASLALLPPDVTLVVTTLTFDADGSPLARFTLAGDPSFVGVCRGAAISPEGQAPRTWWENVPDVEGWRGVFTQLATTGDEAR